MKTKVAINGFGRIGRLVFRVLLENENIEIVAINDLANIKVLTHLLKYDSVYGNFMLNEISNTDSELILGKNKKIKVFSEKNPNDLPWKELDIDLVVESTGFFTTKETAQQHIDAGAKKVIISAPTKGDVKTIVFNVNHNILNKNDVIISGASCTTNGLSPVAKILNDNFGIEKGYMTTVHAATNDQNVVDALHSDLHRARATLGNIIPTSTGAAAAIGLVLPNLNGKLDGIALRVPIITGSVIDLVVELKSQPTIDEINAIMKKSSNETLGYVEDPIVSSDIIGSTYGSIFDATQTKSLEVDGKKLYKLIVWYDNEMSYVNQLVRTINYIGNL